MDALPTNVVRRWPALGVVGDELSHISCCLIQLQAQTSTVSSAQGAGAIPSETRCNLPCASEISSRASVHSRFGGCCDCPSEEAERDGEMEGLTGSEIAGFVVGALLLGATVAAPRVDGFIAASQRRSLGMCKRCGDLRIVACPQCKGVGSVRKGGMVSLSMLDDLYESLGAEAKTDNLVPCTKCRSKGRLLCPECLKMP